MGGKKYIPTNDTEFVEWVRKVMARANLRYEVWGIIEIPATLTESVNDLEKKVNKCKEPTRNKIDTLAKNVARKELEKTVRGYLRGLILYNPAVTEEDRKMMGLPVYDTKPTPVGDPVGQARGDVSYPAHTQLLLHISHVEGTAFDARANYGYRIHYGVYDYGAAKPAVEEELRESRFSRQKKMLFEFRAGDVGKTVWFSIRYENSRGIPGQWGPMFSAIIP